MKKLLSFFQRNKVAEVRSSVKIKANAQAVYNLITSPLELTKIMPGLIAVSDVPTGQLQVESKFGYSYQMYGLGLDGTWVVRKMDPPFLYEGESLGDISSYWTYKLEELDADITEISLTVKYVPPKTLFEKVKLEILNTVNQQSAEAFLNNAKTVLEGRNLSDKESKV